MKTSYILIFLAALFFFNGEVCYSKTINELLAGSGINKEDSKKIEDICSNLKNLNKIKEEDVLLIIENALKDGVDSKYLLRLLTLVSKAAVEDIPTAALINKILEGFAKKVPIDVIIKESETKVLLLKNAKTILSDLRLRGYDAKQPDMAINVMSIYLAQGWESSELKKEIEGGGLAKKEFYELSLFLKRK